MDCLRGGETRHVHPATMISKEFIDLLRRKSPDIRTTIYCGPNGENPVPLDLSELEQDLWDSCGNLIICSKPVMDQIMTIIEYYVHNQNGASRFGQESLGGYRYLSFIFYAPYYRPVTIAGHKSLHNEYWVVNLDSAKLDINQVVGKPIHRIGITKDLI